ncbi:MAG: helix-turn-helix domain-containing protein, partial [Candidatus Rokuibacteriota bacterium]
MDGRVYFWDDRVLYVGPDVPSVLHAHHAVQVVVSLSAPLRFRSSARAPWRMYGGAIVPSDLPHQTHPPVSLLATFWLDPETDDAKRVVAACGAHAIQPIARARVRMVAPRLRACVEDGLGYPVARERLDEVVGILAPCEKTGPAAAVDPRVSRACELLRAAPGRRVPLAQLAAAVALSPSRLAHLLRPHLGLPLRRYLLWLRLRDALREMAQGATITAAAHAVGFADAPHLDRTFRRMLGFMPSAALGVSHFVQDGA